MTRNCKTTNLSEIDLMMLRAGGKTQAEFDALVDSGFGFSGITKSLLSAFDRLSAAAKRALAWVLRAHHRENSLQTYHQGSSEKIRP